MTLQPPSTRSLTPVTAGLNLLGPSMFGMGGNLSSSSSNTLAAGLESFNLMNVPSVTSATSTTVTMTSSFATTPTTTTSKAGQPPPKVRLFLHYLDKQHQHHSLLCIFAQEDFVKVYGTSTVLTVLMTVQNSIISNVLLIGIQYSSATAEI